MSLISFLEIDVVISLFPKIHFKIMSIVSCKFINKDLTSKLLTAYLEIASVESALASW